MYEYRIFILKNSKKLYYYGEGYNFLSEKFATIYKSKRAAEDALAYAQRYTCSNGEIAQIERKERKKLTK